MAKKLKPGDTILRVEMARQSQKVIKTAPPLIKQFTSKAVFTAQVRRALASGAKPAVAAARAAALSLPSKGTASPTQGPRNLRRRIADSIEADVRLGGLDPSVSIISRRDKMGDAPYMPARTNEGRWRHPVMGNMNVWVSQHSRQGWFDQTIARTANRTVRDELVTVLNFLEAKWIIK